MSERYSANPNSLEVGADFPHCSRYLLARGFIKKGETVIDAACGHGYGSYLLSEVASKVYAYDYQDVFNEQWKNDKMTQFINFTQSDDVNYMLGPVDNSAVAEMNSFSLVIGYVYRIK